MARTKNTSSFRNRGWTTTVLSDNGNHSHHTRIGKKFQYVTRAGERKNYMIRSYNPNSGKHSVQRINWRCDRRQHKPKEVLLETLLPNIRWVGNDKRWKEVKAAIAHDFYMTPNSYSNKPLEIINEIFFSKEVTLRTQPRIQRRKLEPKRKRSRTIGLKTPVVGCTSTNTSTSALPRATTTNTSLVAPRSNEEEVQQQKFKRPRLDTIGIHERLPTVGTTARVPLQDVAVVLPPSSPTGTSTASSSLFSCAVKDGKSKADSLLVPPAVATSRQRSRKAPQEVAAAAAAIQNTRKESNQSGEKKPRRNRNNDEGEKQKDKGKNSNAVSRVSPPRPPSTLDANANKTPSKAEESNTSNTNGSAKESVVVTAPSVKLEKSPFHRYTGVYFYGDRRSKPWQARCKAEYAVRNSRRAYIGQFKSAEEAARAFDEIMRQSGRVKDLVHLNFPTSEEKKRAAAIMKRKKSNFRGVTHHPNSLKSYMTRCSKASVVAKLGRHYCRSFLTEIEAAKAWDEVLRKYGTSEELRFLNFPTPEEMHGKSSKQNNNKPSPSSATASSATARISTTEPDSSRKSKAASGRKPLPSLVGDRIASEFGNGVFFGRIEACSKPSFISKGKCKVVFDDGDVHEIDFHEMRKCLDLYKRIIKEEVNSWSHGEERLSSLAVGDRIVFEFGNGVHFGSIQACNSRNKLERKWTVIFDDGDRFEFDCGEMKKSMALCEKIRAKEKKNSSPIKLGTEGSGITTTGGSKERTCSDNNGDEKEKKTLLAKQSKKGGDEVLNTSRNILISDDDDHKEKKETKKSFTRQLSSFTTGDRIAHRSGDGTVCFGIILECNNTQETSTKSADTTPSRTVLFDNGDVHKFDCKRMTEGLALYEETRAQDPNDPQRKEKLRKLEKDFMTQKESVELKIPGCAKKRFLTVGFALWEKQYLPVLFLGPYDVSPGLVRDQWFQAFEKCTTNKNFPQIVYWLGSDFENGFSFSTEDQCLSLMGGAKKGLLKQKSGNSPVSKTFNKALEKLFETHRKPLGPSRIPFKKLKESHECVCVPKIVCLVTDIEL